MSVTELPPRPWVMACGCSTTAVRRLPDGSSYPVCFPHYGIDPGAETLIEPDAQPSLEGRRARCAYFNAALGRCNDTRHNRFSEKSGKVGDYLSEIESSWTLPFFEHCPDQEFDKFFCGCWGWD